MNYHPYPGYDPNAQWQQQQQHYPMAPPPLQQQQQPLDPAMYKDYGYGTTARPGGPSNRHIHQASTNSQPFGNGPPLPNASHQPPTGPHGGPRKRPRYDSQAAQTYAGSPYPPQQHVVQPMQYQPPIAQGPAALPAAQYAQQPQALGAFQPPAHAGLPPNPYHQYPAQQLHQPMNQALHVPAYQQASAQPPMPLAVPQMRVVPMASGNRHNHNNRKQNPNHLHQQAQALLPPPPPSADVPPPPPPPPTAANGSRSTTSLRSSSPKGLASLPSIPNTAALPTNPSSATSNTLPVTPAIPIGPSIKRDTRPLPPQKFTARASLGSSSQGSGRGGGGGGGNNGPSNLGRGKPPTGPSGRGGRGRGNDRFTSDSQRPSSRQQQQQQHTRKDDRFDNREKGYKRTFSQTGPPAGSPRGPATRPRTDVNSPTIPTGPSKKGTTNIAVKRNDRNIEASPAPANSKRSKRTLTDFRIESIEIPEVKWLWKASPLSHILAQMNLKEQEDSKDLQSAIKEEQVEETTLKEATEAEACVQTVQKGEAHLKSSEAVAPTSQSLERSDSRPEKRKHAHDEDDDNSGEVEHTEGREIQPPVGKKVKSEFASMVDQEGASEDTSIALAPEQSPPGEGDLSVSKVEENHVHEESREVESTLLSTDAPGAGLLALAKDDNSHAEHDDGQSSEATSEDEIAGAIIASRPSAEVIVDESQSDQTKLADEPAMPTSSTQVDLKTETLDDEDIAFERGVSQQPGQTKLNTSHKKSWENSRLRIYFMSPVELEQKDVKQTGSISKAKGKGKSVSVKEYPSLEESALDEVPSLEECKVKDEPPVQVPINENDDTEAQGKEATIETSAEDLDGEPLAIPATADTIDESNPLAEAEEIVPLVASLPKDDDVVPESISVQPKIEAEEKRNIQDPLASELLSTKELSLPSQDRLSIAYAQNTRRIVIDADIVDELVVNRGEGTIEITVRLEEPSSPAEGLGFRCAKGFFIEKASNASGNTYQELGVADLASAWADDRAKSEGPVDADCPSPGDLSPPVHRLISTLASSEEGLKRFTVIVKMDRAHPLTEAKWVRSGNADEWIQSVVGNSSSASSASTQSGRAAQQLPKGEQGSPSNAPLAASHSSRSSEVSRESAWKGKIRVVDPDAPPTFQHALENWLSSANSRYGFDEGRYRFVATHFQDANNVLEVLLRLIRGGAGSTTAERAQHGSQSASLALQASASGAPYPDQQNPISLAAFQLFKMGLEAAIEAGVPKAEVEKRIGEVIRDLPYSLIFRSLDSMFSDFKKSTKR